MIRGVSDLAQEYGSALRAFLAGGGEEGLKKAYDFGRRSVGEGVGILVILDVHRKVLEELLQRRRPATRSGIVQQSLDFLAECLAPYDMSHRGFQEAHARLRDLHEECETMMAEQERALRKAEAKYRAHVEQIAAVTFIESVKTGETVYVSPQVEAMLGFTPAEWLGESDRWVKQLHPDDRAAVLAQVSRFHQEGGNIRAEYRLLTRQGREAWVRHVAALVRDEDGRPQFVQGTLMDITAQKEAERASRDLEERFRRIIARCGEAMLVASVPDGNILDASEGATGLFGLSRPDLLARSLFDLFPGNEDRLRQHIEDARVQGEAESGDLKWRDPGGRTGLVHLRFSTISTERDGAILCVVRKGPESRGGT